MLHFVAIFRIIQTLPDDERIFSQLRSFYLPSFMPTTTVFKRSIYLFLLTGIFFLAACSPKYNWREVHGKDAPFVVLLPDKPVTATRDINLDGMSLSMTMTAAEVDGVTYAVGYVVLAEDKQTATALNAMKTALVRNINGTVKPSTNSQGQTAAATNDASNIEVSGSRNNGNGSEPLLLLGHFEAKDRRAYQVIVLGNEKAVSREEASTFLTSFKVN